MNNQEKLATYI